MPRALATSALIGLILAPSAARAANPSKLECIAANDAAQDLRRAGKLRQAREKLALCVSQSCPGPVRDDCNDRLTEVDKAMPTVLIAATDHDGNDMSAVHVLEDGKLVVDHLDGTAFAVDPGEHMFRFEAAGYLPVTRKVVARETEKERRIAIAFGVTTASASEDDSSEPTPREEAGSNSAGSSPWPAYVAFGVGGVGLIGGVVFLVAAVSQQSTLQKDCGGLTEQQCHAYVPGEQSRLTADNWGMGISFGVAAIGAGVGTWLLLSAPPSSSQARSWWVAPRVGLMWVGAEGGFQ